MTSNHSHRFTIALLSAAFITAAFFVKPCLFAADSAEKDISEALAECHRVYPLSGSRGGFLYGYTANTLYSAQLLPDEALTYVTVSGIIRAVSHSGDCAYALYDSSSSQRDSCVLKLNIESGEYESFSVGKLGSADKTSFAVSGDEAFVIKTDDIYAYVQSFAPDGRELHKYKFNSNLSRLFQDYSNVFALLYTGELYQIGNGSSQYVARLETDSTPFNAGDGYIFTDKHELVSLCDGSTEYMMSAKPRLTTASEYGLITHSGSSVKCCSREVLRCSSPAYVLSCKNLCAAVYSDFSYDTTKLNTENDNAKPDKSPAESNRSLRNNSVGQSEDDEISLSIPYPVRNRTICDVEASLSVSEFFSCFDEKPELYNADGARIYNGNVKTGYTLRYNDALYEIAVKGDLNCDGKLKDNDVSALMLHLAGKKPLTGASLIAADYNLDSRVSNADLVLMAKAAEK